MRSYPQRQMRSYPDITANLRDFPDNELAQFGIEALHPDEFVMDLFTLDGARVHQAISATAAAWRNPPALRPTSATASPRRAYRSPRLRCVAEIPRCAAHGLLFQKLYSYRCFETLFWNQLIRRRELGRLDPACTQDGCLTAKEVGRHSWAISWLCSVMLSQITAHTDTRAACGPRVGRILRAGLALPKGTRCVQPVIHEWHHAVCGAQRS